MRVTFGGKYNQMHKTQRNLQGELNELNAKLASGKKIQHSYENSSIYNRDLQLGYQENTLSQGIDIAQNAYNSTLNTDKALSELNSSLMQFNTKLLQVANQPQSQTSRIAIANDLRSLKDHMINIANTSIAGDYLFSGTKIKTPPISPNGNYNGNNEKLEALIGSNVRVPYNITGQELFLGKSTSQNRSITSNIKHYNLTKLQPSIMSKLEKDAPPQEVFIKADDTIRDLFGDNDDDPSNDAPIYFYLQGTRPDGTHFKSKFEFEQKYDNVEYATKVEDLLRKIGQEYGNNHLSKTVDVQLNAWGEIEIKSLVPGSPHLDFNLVASNANVENLKELGSSGAKVMSFQKSPYISSQMLDSITQQNDDFKPFIIGTPTTFISLKENTLANLNTPLQDTLSPLAQSLLIDIGPSASTDQETQENITLEIPKDGTTFGELAKKIKGLYQQNGKNVEVEIAEGKIFVIDLDAQKNGEKTPLTLKITALDHQKQPVAGIPTNYQLAHDDVFFEKNSSKLVSNISQILLDNSGYAKDTTKLSEVAGDLVGQVYTLNIKDHNGQPIQAQLSFEENGGFLILPSLQSNEEPYRIPIVDLNEKGASSITPTQNITYRQLMGAFSLALNYSNQEDKTYKALSSIPQNFTIELKELYEKTIIQAQSRTEISLNQKGQMQITDRVHSVTKMDFSFSNQNDLDFSAPTIQDTMSGLRLHSNNALTVKNSFFDFFGALDTAISAVQDGIYRPDEFPLSYNDGMRNIGIQNSLDIITQLTDHIEKVTALNGAYGRNLENSIEKNQALKTQIQNLKGENMGADIAETYNKFQTLSTNYDAALSSAGKINKMTILDYV
ncbi:hypothetical protein BBW65_06385 [Helicobacter enhydrae]|uniref:Flagellin N-terminal domain-containing protein n=1 Tax=Helicobacter enhydrae TaxID=222136 RepID=A0A1B1U6Y5_9HELI|nr:flagellar hook-associated protein FlgL [Helicobacter enhydrae]ANV98445.1 hypothetical protein BBW65_06385 [Helicobacter enhydrae]